MKILLVGYYGFGNLGDELLCTTAQAVLKPLNPRLTILDKQHRSLPKTLKLLGGCDCLLFAGGSLLQDVSGRGLTVLYYAWLCWLAKRLGKKLFFVAQGIGPVKRILNRWLVKRILRSADYISVRNKESAAFLQALGINNFRLFNDLLFSADLRIIPRKTKKRKTSLVFSFKGKMNINLDKIAQEHSLVAMHKYQDVGFSEKQRILQTIASADLAVGMRLHFLILAAKFNVPFIGIAYDPKVESLCRRLQMPVLEVKDMAKLAELIRQETPKIPYRKNQLKKAVQQEEKLARESIKDLRQELRHAFR